MFYTTDISVSIWIINKNKKAQNRNIGDEVRNYRNREKEILFMDLRQKGEPFEKKFIQFNEQHIKEVSTTYHSWQQENSNYVDIPEFCYSAKLEEVVKKDFSLVPSKYIKFINHDENIDFNDKMNDLKTDITELLKAEAQSKTDLLTVFKELGFEIKL
jgi:type I restriction enzyme M protein